MALYVWSAVKKTYEHNVILETNLQVKKKTTVERKFLLDQFRKCTPFFLSPWQKCGVHMPY